MTFLKRRIRRNLILLSGAAVSEQAAHPSVPYGRGDSAVGGPPWRGDRDSGWRLEEASLEAGANGKDKDVSGEELRSNVVGLVVAKGGDACGQARTGYGGGDTRLSGQ